MTPWRWWRSRPTWVYTVCIGLGLFVMLLGVALK
jgi:hypothetical protein